MFFLFCIWIEAKETVFFFQWKGILSKATGGGAIHLCAACFCLILFEGASLHFMIRG